MSNLRISPPKVVSELVLAIQPLPSQKPELQALSDEDRDYANTLAFSIKSVIDSGQFKPPLLPEVAVSLMSIANDDDADVAQIESTVARDPTVAARIVSIANSSLFNRGSQVSSLRVALVRLGLGQVRDIAFQVVAQTRVFRVPGYADRMRELYERSLAAGITCQEIDRRRNQHSELAYLCGLLHDIGEATILGIIADNAKSTRQPTPDLAKLGLVISEYHALIGAWVCKKWKLPEQLVDAIIDHHQPERSTCGSQLAWILCLADNLFLHGGIGCQAKPLSHIDEAVLQKLGLGEDSAQKLLKFSEELAINREQWAGIGIGT